MSMTRLQVAIFIEINDKCNPFGINDLKSVTKSTPNAVMEVLIRKKIILTE